jgi:3-dehydroquinate synthase
MVGGEVGAMFELEVKHVGVSYRVHGEAGALARAGKLFRDARPEARRAFVVTDEHLHPLYLKPLAATLAEAGLAVAAAAVPPDAEAASEASLGSLYRDFAAGSLTSSDLVVALGGSRVVAVAGFAAATFKYGVPWAVVPTTLRCQLEGCLGGRVGVDFDGAPGQVGTYHPPSVVVVDGEFLATLPAKYVAGGLAEAVKYALLDGEDFFKFMEDNAPALARAGETLDAVVERGLTYKASALARQEGERRENYLLNLGYALGRAFERAGRFALAPGEALALGLVYTALFAELRGECATETVIRLATLLRRFNLPTHLPTINLEKTLEALIADRQVAGGEIYLAVPRAVGEVMVEPIALQNLAELLPQIHRLARSMA